MKLKNIILSLLGFVALATSCVKEGPAFFSEVKAEPSFVSIDKDGGNATVKLTTTGAWSICDVPEWLSVSKLSGEAAPNGEEITLSAKKAYESLSAEICIKVGGVSQVIKVAQTLGKDLSITTVKDFVENGVDGRTYTIQGKVKRIVNTEYGNFYMNDGTSESKDAYVYGTLDAGGGTKNFLSLGIEEGDEIIVSGPRQVYGSDIELVNVTVIKIVQKSLIAAKQASYTIKNAAGSLLADITAKSDSVQVIPQVDWISFEGFGEKGKYQLSYTENTGSAIRTGTFVVKCQKTVKKELLNSELTITVNQLPALGASKLAADINYSTKELVAVEGQIAALGTDGFVLFDGSENEVNKVFIECAGFDYTQYKVGQKVYVAGKSEKKYARNKVVASYLEVTDKEAKYTHPTAVELNKDNAATILGESPTKYGYYTVKGFVDSSKNILIPESEQVVTALNPIKDIDLKSLSGKYASITGYYTDNNSSKKQIQFVVTEAVEAKDAPSYFKLSEKSKTLDWDKTSAKFQVIANSEWTASLETEVKGVVLSKTSGKSSGEIELVFQSDNRNAPNVNNSYDDQKVNVKVTCGDKELDYELTRSGKKLSVKVDKANVDTKENEVFVTITASKFWTISVDKGGKLEKTEGFGGDVVKLTVPENKSENSVTYTITLSDDREATAKAVTATITQEGTKPTIVAIPEGDGTLEKPYNPTQALELAKALASGEKSGEVYVQGYVTSISDISGKDGYGNATYKLSFDGKEDIVFDVFRGKYFGGEKFPKGTEIKVGDCLVIKGQLTNYKGTTPQMNQNSELISINGKTE